MTKLTKFQFQVGSCCNLHFGHCETGSPWCYLTRPVNAARLRGGKALYDIASWEGWNRRQPGFATPEIVKDCVPDLLVARRVRFQVPSKVDMVTGRGAHVYPVFGDKSYYLVYFGGPGPSVINQGFQLLDAWSFPSTRPALSCLEFNLIRQLCLPGPPKYPK